MSENKLSADREVCSCHECVSLRKDKEIERLQKEIKFLKQLAYTHVDPTGETPEVQEYMVKLVEEEGYE